VTVEAVGVVDVFEPDLVDSMLDKETVGDVAFMVTVLVAP